MHSSNNRSSKASKVCIGEWAFRTSSCYHFHQWFCISWALDCVRVHLRLARVWPDVFQSRSLPVISSAECRSGAVPVPRPGAGLWQRPTPKSPSSGCKCHHDVSKIDISAGFNLKRVGGGFHPEAWCRTTVRQSVAFHPSRCLLWPTDWLSLWLDTLMGALCDSSQGG